MVVGARLANNHPKNSQKLKKWECTSLTLDVPVGSFVGHIQHNQMHHNENCISVQPHSVGY